MWGVWARESTWLKLLLWFLPILLSQPGCLNFQESLSWSLHFILRCFSSSLDSWYVAPRPETELRSESTSFVTGTSPSQNPTIHNKSISHTRLFPENVDYPTSNFCSPNASPAPGTKNSWDLVGLQTFPGRHFISPGTTVHWLSSRTPGPLGHIDVISERKCRLRRINTPNCP
jgi:hypothetical protein